MYVRMVEHEDSAGQRVTEQLRRQVAPFGFAAHVFVQVPGAFGTPLSGPSLDGVGVPTEVTPTPYRDTLMNGLILTGTCTVQRGL
jgi:hypothetical protein